MKNIWLKGLMVLVLTGSAYKAYADEDMPVSADNPHLMSSFFGDGDYCWESFETLKARLVLTDDQGVQLKALLKDNREDCQEIRDKERADRANLREKIESQAGDDAIRLLLDKLSADQKNMELQRRKTEDSARAILNPTQEANFVLHLEKNRHEHEWMDRDGDRDEHVSSK